VERLRTLPGNAGVPETREAVRSQVVRHGHASSLAIARILDVPHPTVVRILERYAAAGHLSLARPADATGGVEVVVGTLSPRFRNLSLSLW
jgi:hypothetical protein